MSVLAEQIALLYHEHAHEWDAARGKGLLHGASPGEAAWLARFVSLLPHGDASVLDIGCGSGEPIARFLIDKGLDLTGADIAPAMIAMCRARFPAQMWHEADMRSLALGRRFGGLIAWDSFFHLTPQDQHRMFAIFRAHAVTDAVLMFTSGPEHGEAIGCFAGQPLYHGSLSSAAYRHLLESHGFEVLAHAINDPICGGHTIWLARLSHRPDSAE